MLWNKETNEKDAVYIELLKNRQYPVGKFPLHCKKNNKLSLSARENGNQKVKEGDFKDAMMLYNRSICLAEDKHHLSLAYGNRSYCFFQLNIFDRCLVDIKYAIDAHYPALLASKLEQRKLLCLKNIETQTKSTYVEPKLSFEASCALPCMANVLQIEKNVQYGRMVTSNNDIAIGETVVIEEAYVRLVTSDANKCYSCSKQDMNFVPCLNCGDTMYCSELCSNNKLHQFECDMVFSSEDNCSGTSLNFILRSVLIGLNTFTTIDEMMEFVERCRLTDPKEIPESLESNIAKYRTFFKLSSISDQQILDFRSTYLVFHTIKNSTKLGEKFETKAKQRFLVHLILHHCCILSTNAFGGLCKPHDEISGNKMAQVNTGSGYEYNLFLLTSYINHSCIPNLAKLSKGNLAIVKAIQPIKKGQQLFITYLNDEQVKMNGKLRNDVLDSKYGFRCGCELCRIGFKKCTINLELDSDFQYIVRNVPHFNFNLVNAFKEHCTSFLLKYPDMFASEEGLYILNTLEATLQKEISGF